MLKSIEGGFLVMEAWGRIITAMVTPFDEKGNFNIESAKKLAKKLVSEGTTAILAAGTTGESPTLTEEEKLILFSELKKALDVPVIANVGSNNTEQSAKFAEKVKETGVDGIMAVVPYYNKPNKTGLYAHFEEIAQAAGLPLLLYNVPGRTALNMDGDFILKLAEIPNVVSIKEATGDFDKISRVIREAPEGFSVYTGEDLLTLPVLAVGGYGVVSVASHVVGKQMSAMIESYLAGNIEKAQEIHLSLIPIYKSLFMTANPIPVKAALKIQGFEAGTVRLPLVDADETVIAKVTEDLQILAQEGGI